MNQRQNTQVSETRAAPRERMFVAARLSYAHGALSVACTVTQLSATGARLNIADPASLPDMFDISIPHKDFNSRARMIWREGSKAGIEFLAPAPAPEATTADYQEKIRVLEALNARFKAQIVEMTTQLHRLTDEA